MDVRTVIVPISEWLALGTVLWAIVADVVSSRRVRKENARRQDVYARERAAAQRNHTVPPCPPNRLSRG